MGGWEGTGRESELRKGAIGREWGFRKHEKNGVEGWEGYRW